MCSPVDVSCQVFLLVLSTMYMVNQVGRAAVELRLSARCLGTTEYYSVPRYQAPFLIIPDLTSRAPPSRTRLSDRPLRIGHPFRALSLNYFPCPGHLVSSSITYLLFSLHNLIVFSRVPPPLLPPHTFSFSCLSPSTARFGGHTRQDTVFNRF